jgi:MYXO-CTERM domain-containing protein
MLTTLALALAAQMPILDAPFLDRVPTLKVPISLEDSQQHQRTMMFAPGGEPLPIFLNRWGGQYTGGPDDSSTNTSSIVPGATANIGPFSGTDEDWSEVLTCVQDLFSQFNTYVTDFEPLEGEYVEAVIGGTPDQLGMPFGVGGVAPYDPFGCGIISQAVVYAFSDVYAGDNRAICETAAQEIAHAFSLDHEFLCEDPMTYLDGCGEKSFQDTYAPCGEFEERECSCERPSQNSVQLMFELLGPGDGVEVPPPPVDLEDPVLTMIEPVEDGSREAFTTFEIVADASDDVGLVSVSVLWDLTGESMHCPSSGDGWSCSREGTRHTWRVEVSEGMRTFEVKARDVAGKVASSGERHIWFGTGPNDVPPDDDTPPEVTIVTPIEADILPVGTEIPLVATAYDADTRVLNVALVMQTSRGEFAIPCPVDSRWVTCTQEGGTNTWMIRRRRASQRAYQVVAWDLMGNEGASDIVNLTFAENAPPGLVGDAHEFNDTWDVATPMACGDSLDLMINFNDTDWLELDAPAGHIVTLEPSGNVGDEVQLSAHSSPIQADVIKEPASGPMTFTMVEGARAKIRAAAQGLYSVSMSCAEPEPEPEDPPAACAHSSTGSSAPLGVLALLGLIALGRRRSRA